MKAYLGIGDDNQKEISNIEVNHSFLNLILSYNEWNISMQYTDKPGAIYHYSWKDGEIIEGGISGNVDKEDLKHRE